MAAYAALVSLLNNIHQIMNHPRLSTCLEKEHIQPLLEKTNFLLDFMEDNKYGGRSKEAEDLERKIASAAHAAEDLIESHIVDQIHAAEEMLAWPNMFMFLLKCVGCHVGDRDGKSLDMRHINEYLHAVMKEANEFKEKRRLGVEQLTTHLAVAKPVIVSGETTMIGLDAELIQLLGDLTGYQSSRRIISIVGMGGIGKTTLAKNVSENLFIKEKFQFRAWATISQQNNAGEVMSELLSGLGELSNGTVDDLGLRLHKTLSGRKYLIILDDIWSVQAWDELKHFFPDNKNGSRIVLTTRLSNVAKDCGSSLFMMSLLNDESSWKLFHETAFKNDDCPPELREVGEEIVKLCKGLALSIVVIGGLLLKSPRTVRYWKTVANDLKSIPFSKEKQGCLDVLSLSYYHLPPHLKPCFLYMGVFKEDSQIRISKIIKLWIGEGFIKPIGSQVLEEIGEGYINDLIDRNLILVGRLRKNGKLGSCGIHDLLRDLCIKVGEQDELFHVNRVVIRGTERRLIDEWYIEGTGVEHPLARSIIAREFSKQTSDYRLLRVLDKANYNSEANYYKNFNLRYLAHKQLYVKSLWELPTSISRIWNLQTLIIDKSCVSLIVAPIEFWKMRLLRHVKCGKIYVPDPPRSNGQDSLLILVNLQTLTSVVNFRLCEEVCKIIPNIKKLHLVYDRNLLGYSNSLVECVRNVDRLHKLESHNLKIHVRIMVILDWKLPVSYPSSLKKLSLSECRLHWNDLQAICSLPQLEILNLEFFSVTEGEHWRPVNGQFPRLKFLKIDSCDLVCWEAEESHFPILEQLLLTSLYHLEEIPLAIGDIPTLQLIRVDRCSESAAISAVKIKEDQLENDDLKVQVVVRKRCWESFNQMLETEALTINNIHLRISRYEG